VNLEQADRALHEFTDALHAYSQSEGDLPVSEAFRPQQYTLALLRRELRKSIFELPHSFIQNDLLFRTWSWVYVFPNHWARLPVFGWGTASLGAVNIH
jgi:hypothetical protein